MGKKEKERKEGGKKKKGIRWEEGRRNGVKSGVMMLRD